MRAELVYHSLLRGVECVEARAPKKPDVWLPTEGEKVWVEATVSRTAAGDDGTLDKVTVIMPNGNRETFPWGTSWIKPLDA